MSTRIPTFVLLGALVGLTPSATPTAQVPGVRTIEITAERFEFWPSEVTVDEGEQVELRIRSDDTMHGFRLLGGGVNVLIPKRGKGYAVAKFTGSRPGRYTFECSRLCGAGHNFMRGVLIVRPASAEERK